MKFAAGDRWWNWQLALRQVAPKLQTTCGMMDKMERRAANHTANIFDERRRCIFRRVS
jgi:hypothetical protein